MLQIRHDYISVGYAGTPSYGGSQMRASSKAMREVGCGAVAALDLLIYLNRWHAKQPCGFFRQAAEDGVIDADEYNELLQRLSRRFFPIIPKFGINGLMLAGGINAFCIRYALPFRATWGLGSRHIFEQIESMLRQDIPVILAVGPNFPLFWQKNDLTFYARTRAGVLGPVCGIHAHYVTVTGIDEQRLHISSWGREYYIEREEYLSYIRKHSGSIVSNIVRIRQL